LFFLDIMATSTSASESVRYARRAADVANIARPESVVMLAETVRAARELLRPRHIDGLKERLSEGGYAVSSKELAQCVLATNV
jgi:hypothetical protein